MNRRAKIFAMAALGCLTLACGINDGETADNRQIVEIDVSIDRQTLSRVTVAGDEFEEDDEFRFFFNSGEPTVDEPPITGGDDDALKITEYKYVSGKWTPTAPIYWDDHKLVEERKFCAVMPFETSDYDVAGSKFTVQADQSASAGYEKSDLLMARVSTAERLIPLKFYHMMAKVVVVVRASIDELEPDAFSADAFDVMTATLNNVRLTGAITFEALTSTAPEYDPAITVSGDTGETNDVKMLELELELEEAEKEENMLTMKFTALIPHQTVTKDELLLTFSHVEGTDTKTYYMKAPSNAEFEQGMSTIVTVTLEKSKVEIAEENAGISIAEWGEIKITHDGPPIELPD